MNAVAFGKRRLKCPVCERIVDRKSRQPIFRSTHAEIEAKTHGR